MCDRPQHFPGDKSVFSVGLLLFYRISGNVGCLTGSDPPQPPLKRQGVFKVGGKKEKESDLLLIKFQKDHYFGFFKKC